jgi:hypothetical protein
MGRKRKEEEDALHALDRGPTHAHSSVDEMLGSKADDGGERIKDERTMSNVDLVCKAER